MFKNELKLCGKCRQFNYRRFFSSSRTNSDILSDIFGLTNSEATRFLEKQRLQYKDGEMLLNSVKICRSFGYEDDDILTTPGLLRANPLILEQHYLSLEEGGFRPIHPEILVGARKYMKKVIKSLKKGDLIPETTNVPEKLLSYIKDEDIAENISVSNFSEDSKWNVVHKSILEDYLKLRLNASQDEIIRLFRIYKMIKNKSFRIIQENIEIAKDLGFEEKKILKYGYLLHNYPNYPKTVLKDFPNLAGSDMKRAMRLYPKLAMTSPSSIIKIYGILKEFDISDEAIRKQMNIFHMSPETVRLRLQEIERSPDFSVLLKHPKLLSLIVHHNRAKSRLSYLQKLQLRCASIMVLGTNHNEVFDGYVREGKDINRITDLVNFLKTLLTVNGEYIKNQLRLHPYYLQVPLKDMQETYEYLISQHFHPADILKILYILLYPKEKVEKALNEINSTDTMEYVSKGRKLSLILYFMEKDHHFTGNGVWRKYDNPEIAVPEKTLE